MVLDEIDEKLLLYILNEASDIERDEVDNWLRESRDHQEYFRNFSKYTWNYNGVRMLMECSRTLILYVEN